MPLTGSESLLANAIVVQLEAAGAVTPESKADAITYWTAFSTALLAHLVLNTTVLPAGAIPPPFTTTAPGAPIVGTGGLS